MQNLNIFCRAPSFEAFGRFARLMTSLLDIQEVAFACPDVEKSYLFQAKTKAVKEGRLNIDLKSFHSAPLVLFEEISIGNIHLSPIPAKQNLHIIEACLKNFIVELELTSKNLSLEDLTAARFKNIFDQAPFSIQIFNLAGFTLAINPSWRKIFKLPEEIIQNFILKEYNVLTDPILEASGILPLIKRAFAGEIVDLPEVFYDPKKVGVEAEGQWLKAQIFPLRNSRGDYHEVVLIHRNVTEIKVTTKEKQKLLQIQDRALKDQKILSKATSILLSTLDYDRIIHDVADACVEDFCDGLIVDIIEGNHIHRLVTRHRFPETEFLLGEVRRLFPPDFDSPQPSSVVIRSREPEFLQDVDAEVISKKTKCKDHADLIKKIGIHSHIAVPLIIRGKLIGALNFLMTSDRPKFSSDDFSLSLELSRRASIAIENAKLYQDAQKAIQLRDDFISIASHELKTPITSMKLQMQAATKILHPGPDGQIDPVYLKNLTDISNRQLDRLTRLIEDMLDISRISHGKLALNIARRNLSTITQEVLDRFVDQMTEEKISFTYDIDPDIMIYCDSYRIEQVITNLISNAIRYGQKKPIHVSLKMIPGAAELTVKDHGMGIAKVNHQRIFERFERAISYIERSGLGLGLYISKEITEEHQGTISVESSLEKGATFKVILPAL